MTTDYWANEKDPDVLAETLKERISQFYQMARGSYFWNVAATNWLYYHGIYFDGWDAANWSAVKQLTENTLGVSVNHFQNLLDNIYTIVCQKRISFQTRASQNDIRSFEEAKIGQYVVDHYRREKGLEQALKRSVRHALVMLTGYVHHPWDRYGGERELVPTIGAGGELSDDFELQMQGDFRFECPALWDVVYDPGVREWENNHWLIVRSFENRFEVAARAKNEEEELKIVDIEPFSDDAADTLVEIGLFTQGSAIDRMSDIIPIWNFYHLPTLACPDGVFFQVAGADVPLGPPQPLNYYRLPVTRVTAGEVLLTQFGNSPATSLRGPQELLNAEVSMIATNHQGAGFSWIWAPDGSELMEEDIGDGVIFIRGGNVPPQGGSFQANSPDHERFSSFLIRTQETLSGVNSTARGVPEPNLKSGEALKVMDAKAHQSASPLQESYSMALEEIGTFIVRTARDRMTGDEERVISIVGENARSRVSYFRKSDLKSIDRIIVDASNPITDTIAGKMWMGEQLIQRGLISTPQEFITVVRTGQLDPLWHSDQAQIERIQEENERLSKGAPARVAAHTDNHVLDIREHAALISNPDVRENPQLMTAVGAHLAEHFAALADPNVQWCMQVLGFPTAPPLMPVGMSGGQPPPPPKAQQQGGGQPQITQKARGALPMTAGEPSQQGAGGQMQKMLT